MTSRLTSAAKPDATDVYAAAARWVDRALRTDDSVFTPGVPIWTLHGLRDLRRRFLDRPDEGRGGFYAKLKAQLQGSSPEAYQLIAEVLYAHFLIISQRQMKGGTKRSQFARGHEPMSRAEFEAIRRRLRELDAA